MKTIRYGLIVIWMLVCSVISAEAQVNVGIGVEFPAISIGLNLPLFPHLVPVPGYPVYYAPSVDANYFFYDGMYWVYQNDIWYASSWYNGPWSLVKPEVVPLFVLRIPVRYYQQPPAYFHGWHSGLPPRWGQQWGHDWERRRSGWDRWKRSSVTARAPLPVYQRQYSGDRYPQVEQQHALRSQSYRYQARDKMVREHLKPQAEQKTHVPVQPKGQDMSPIGNQQPPQRLMPHQQSAPAFQGQRQQPGAAQREQQAPTVKDQGQRPQDRGKSQEHNRGHEQRQKNDEEKSQERNR